MPFQLPRWRGVYDFVHFHHIRSFTVNTVCEIADDAVQMIERALMKYREDGTWILEGVAVIVSDKRQEYFHTILC